jgi:hypothetical protein
MRSAARQRGIGKLIGDIEAAANSILRAAVGTNPPHLFTCPRYEMVGGMRRLSASLLASREDGYTLARGSGRIGNCS